MEHQIDSGKILGQKAGMLACEGKEGCLPSFEKCGRITSAYEVQRIFEMPSSLLLSCILSTFLKAHGSHEITACLL